MSGEDPLPGLQMAEIRDIERGRGREREKEKGRALMSSLLRALRPFMKVPPS